jgi:NDP-sugar pyrophosphorylase family protein
MRMDKKSNVNSVKKCLVLAAGKGTRLRPYTDHTPKPLLKLQGKPILEYILEGIIKLTPIREFCMIVGYKKEMIEEWCQNEFSKRMESEGNPISFKFIEQKEINGTGGATLLAKEWVGSENFMEVYGDILVFHPIYQRLYQKFSTQLEQSGNQSLKYTLVGNYTSDPSSGAAIYVDENNVITDMIEKPPKDAKPTCFNNAGLYVFTPKIFEELENTGLSPRGEIELTAPIIQQIKEKDPPLFVSMTKEEFWCDVGTKQVFDELEIDESLKKRIIG